MPLTNEQRKRKNELARKRYQEKLKYDENYMEARRRRDRELRQNDPELKKQRDRAYYEKTREDRIKTAAKWYKKIREEAPERNMICKIKNRCKRKGIPFNLEPDDIRVPEFCPILGIPLEFCHENNDHWPSVDRLIPELGYVKGNVAVISNRANLLKNNATLDEIKAIARWMEDQYNKSLGNNNDNNNAL